MRPLLAVAGWIAAAGAAIGIGLAGVHAIGNGITDGRANDVLSAEEAARELAAARPEATAPPSATAQPTATPPSTSAAPPSEPPSEPLNVRVFAGSGGTVQAGCLPAGAVIVTLTPAQGYSVKDYRRGPGEYAEVRFDREGGNSGRGGGDSRVRIRCVAGAPVDSWN